jgi:hypothetical protein
MVQYDLIESSRSGRLFLHIDCEESKITIEVTNSLDALTERLEQPPTVMDH